MGNCCTLADPQFVFITLLNDFFFFFLIISHLKFSTLYPALHLKECDESEGRVMEHFLGKKQKLSMENEIGENGQMNPFPVRTNRFALVTSAYAAWMWLKPDLVIRQQIRDAPTLFFSSSFLFLSFILAFFFGGGVWREMVCTWYCCVGTPIWDLIREPLERCLFKSAHVHSEWEQVKAIRYNVITFLERERGSFYTVSQLGYTTPRIFSTA